MRLSLHPNPLMPFLSMTRIVTFFFDFRMGYDLVVLFHERTCELLPCGQQWRKLVKLFRRPKSKFYWYDFTVRGRRYRGSTQESKSVRASKVASLKLASVMENTDPLPGQPIALSEYADRFLEWVSSSRLEEETRRFYRNGWRLLKATAVAEMRIDQITGDCAEQLKFPGSAANANCALRTLRRMLHKAEEWKMIGHSPKIKLMKEHGRHLRLDDGAERKLLAGASTC